MELEPDALVALIARQNDINANLLFEWRRHYLEGADGLATEAAAVAAPQETQTALLSAGVVEDPPKSLPADDRVCEVETTPARALGAASRQPHCGN